MAALDKIYGTKEQMLEFRNWCKKNNKEALNYFYTWTDEMLKSNSEHVITNFPITTDRWLIQNCPINWVKDKIHEQYGPITISKWEKEK